MSAGIVVRKCDTLAEFHDCVELQREVWREQDLEVEPATMFVVAANTGGQVLGAFVGRELVGYTLAVVGWRDGRPFLHSHHTAVHGHHRDRGVGRMLKLFQREEALDRGIRLIEWTFDPLELRNAHFNLNRLGAICRRYLPNFYGVTTSPLHRGLPTDRLVAEWHLDSSHVAAVINGTAAETSSTPAAVELPSALEQWKQTDPARIAAIQSHLWEEFGKWFARGYAALELRTTTAGSAYLLAPWSES
jgi:predicted GNAT superfamily acetyltransferase